MAHRIPYRHHQIVKILASRNSLKKRISEAAVAGLVIYGWAKGVYGETMMHTIVKQIALMRDEGNLQMSNQTFDRILDVLEFGTPESITELRYWQWEISYRLDYHILHNIKFEVVTKMNEGIDVLKRFQNLNPFGEERIPLYVDTENAHHNLRGEPDLRRLALITVFDTYSNTVLLFRVQDLNDKQLEKVRYTLRELNRDFVTFDDEKILSATSGGGSIAFQQLQRHKEGKLQSLKEAVSELPNGFDMDKMETMSDWTAPFLTPDQMYYAAMDAVVLHDLKKWEEEEWRKKEWIRVVSKLNHQQ